MEPHSRPRAKNAKDEQTPERILDEAARLFADNGFDGVSVREITRAAKCNLSAVNYHFGSKKGLYLEVFRQRVAPRKDQMLERLSGLQSLPDLKPDMVVADLARAFLQMTDEQEWRRWHHRLMMMEMSNPTEAFDVLVNDFLKPVYDKLADVLSPFVTPGTDRQALMLMCMSTVFQAVVFSFSRPAVSSLVGRDYDDQFRETLINHISDFSVKGMCLAKPEDCKNA